jgi:hypothetical protein
VLARAPMSFGAVSRSGWGTIGMAPRFCVRTAQWRQQHRRSGNEGGPIHDLADFHFAGTLV